MNWQDLTAEITAVGATGSSDAPITGIEYDSRRVRPGSVFVAMKGGSADGNKFVDKAIAAGALGIITDSAPTFDHLTVYQAGLPVLEVEHGRRALAQASAAFFGHPERATRLDRHHRHQRQNHHRLPHRATPQRGLPQNHSCWHHRIPRCRRNAPLHPHHSRIPRPLRVDGRRRLPRRNRTRHRSLKPRPGPGPHGRDPLRRRRLHQPHPRPSRLPPDHGEVFRRQALAL